MATTTITVASFQTACAECADAIASGDWGTATRWYARAEAINSGLELAVSGAGKSATRRNALDGLRTAIAEAKAVCEAESAHSRFVKVRVSHGI